MTRNGIWKLRQRRGQVWHVLRHDRRPRAIIMRREFLHWTSARCQGRAR